MNFVRNKLVSTVLLALISCAGSPESMREGWHGRDMLRHKTHAAPPPSVSDIDARKEISLKTAVDKARLEIVVRLKSEFNEGTDLEFNQNRLSREMEKQLLETVNNGRVVAAAWDERQNCTMLYEVRQKDLRKIVHLYRWE